MFKDKLKTKYTVLAANAKPKVGDTISTNMGEASITEISHMTGDAVFSIKDKKYRAGDLKWDSNNNYWTSDRTHWKPIG